MKKIFTLLVAVGIITFAQAQPGYGQHSGRDQRNSPSTVDKDYRNGKDGGDYGNDRNYNGIISPERQRDLAIDRINREYDFKIQNVRDNFFKSRSQKRRQIRLLNNERQQEIKMTNAKFSHEIRRYNDHRSNRRY
ncbi:MAG: hypothetical protein ABI675_02375 [Chitinophagaceae bacterium]